jgi:hypothetical protein
MKLDRSKLKPVDWKKSIFGLALLAVMLLAVFLVRAEQRSNSIFWLVIILLLGLVIWALGHDPFVLTGVADYRLNLRLFFELLLLIAAMQAWKLFVFQGVFHSSLPAYSLLARLGMIVKENILPQGLGEELLFRVWLLFPSVSKSRWRFWLVLMAQALCFLPFHLASFRYAVFAFGFALINGISVARSRSILPASFIHTCAPLLW